MFEPTSLVPGLSLEDPKEDFRGAKRVEQYRLSEKALYIPAGLRWNYLPLSAVRSAQASHRVVSAGKCVSVDLHRPTLALETDAGPMKLDLERQESLEKLLREISPKP